jgi:nitroimidazol reductase NimA-like FMN-containing flavoprotein (pyridoxamine 5'-phosphate oxidase superfamily)
MSDERTRLRRSDRAMPSDREIEALLHRAQVAFIATSVSDQPYIHPNLFWFDEENRRVYFHTATEGRTISNVERNSQVCFSVAEMGRLLPAETALEFSTEYASVIAFGDARIVKNNEEKRYGLQGLLDKYFPDLLPNEDYRSMTRDELDQTAVYAIEIDAWSGKQKVKAQ